MSLLKVIADAQVASVSEVLFLLSGEFNSELRNRELKAEALREVQTIQ